MRQALLTVFVLLTLLAAATAPTPAAAAASDGLAPDGVTIKIDIQGDGDARWTISTSYNLNDSSDRRAFDDVASSFERGQGDVGFSIQTFETVVPEVEERTERNMSIESPEWTSAVENDSGTRRGYLRLSFTWTNFANARNDTVTLGGAFRGGWFGDLDRDQTLVIEPPAGFDVSSAQPSHETVNGTLRWTGPVTFGPNEPVATFERQPVSQGIPWVSIAGAVLTALVIGGIVAYAWFWRTTRGPGPAPGTVAETGQGTGDGGRTGVGEGTETVDHGGTASGAGTAREGAGGRSDTTGGDAESEATEDSATAGYSGERGVEAGDVTEGDSTAEAGATAGAAAGAGTSAGGEAEDEAGTEGEEETVPELLSDEERVERLLNENNGRMKQAKIVEETRWSNAKVSQLLSQMAEEGRVEKLRIGRENLISLPKDEETDGGWP